MRREDQPDIVTVVVPTRNSGGTLEQCLESIRWQTYAAIELIVVDNGSTDSTRESAERLADVIAEAGPERSAQRNHGAAMASGRFVLMVDSDMVLDKAVVQQCVEAVHEQGIDVLVIPERSVGSGFWAACKALERSCYVGDDTIEAARFFSKAIYERYGGYDETLTGPEDWDLPARMRQDGVHIGRISAEILHQEGHLRLRDTVAKKFYYGSQFGDYLQRHPELARRQLTFVRPAFIRHRKRLARTPILLIGMIVMKFAEASAGVLGIASSRWRKA